MSALVIADARVQRWRAHLVLRPLIELTAMPLMELIAIVFLIVLVASAAVVATRDYVTHDDVGNWSDE